MRAKTLVPERRDPWILKKVSELLLLRYRVQVIGGRHLPSDGAVVACNHLMHTDFRFHLRATNHSLRFLGIRDNTPWRFANLLIRLLFRLSCGLIDALLAGYVVFREKGRPLAPSLTGRVLRDLSLGHYLVVMSEGRVSTAEQDRCFYRGAGYFALKAGCPVVPVAVSVRRRGLVARKVLYHVGAPVPPPGHSLPFRARTFRYTEAIHAAVRSLLEQDNPRAGPPPGNPAPERQL
jgi:1-acyl-sn-glycerol-3-phosphate acyltransferase